MIDRLAPIFTDLSTGILEDPRIVEARRCVGDLAGYWGDERAAAEQKGQLLYITQSWFPVDEGTEGALLWGNTTLMPGIVGDEYFMTRGHWHEKRDRGELCLTVAGRGALVLMDENRDTRIEEMRPGTTHHVPGHTAHRTVNTGDEPLVFLCCWPADCGHDYSDIAQRGFSGRVLRVDGQPKLVGG